MKEYKVFIGNFFLILLVALMSWTWDFVEIVKVSNGAQRLESVYESIVQPPNAKLILKSYEREFQRYVICSFYYPMKESDVKNFFENSLENSGWEKVDITNQNDGRWIRIQRYLKGNLELLLLREVDNADENVWNIKISFLPYMQSWNKETQKIVLKNTIYSIERALLAASVYLILSSIYKYVKRIRKKG